METKVTYNSLCTEYSALSKKAYKALMDALNERGVLSINVKAYMENELIDWFTFPQTDKNGYGVNVKIDTIKKSDKGEWVADVVEAVSDGDFNTLAIDQWNFGASELIDILGIVECIFAVADDEYNGKVLAENENFEEEE